MRSFRYCCLLALLAPTALACSFVYQATPAGPNFDVKATAWGQPASGIRVEAAADVGGAKHTAITDKNGIAHFRQMPRGSYSIHAGDDNAYVDVKDNRRSEVTVALSWPTTTPLSTKSLKGYIRASGSPEPLSLDLLEGASRRVLMNVQTDETGAFEFAGVSPGRYFINIKGGSIPIVVEPGASAESLDIEVSWTSCGLQYADQNRCPKPKLHLARLAGNISDTSGGALVGTTVLVFDSQDKLVSRTSADTGGNFVIPPVPQGTYTLFIERNGWTGLRGTVTLDSTGSDSSLRVQLGIGSCSSVR